MYRNKINNHQIGQKKVNIIRSSWVLFVCQTIYQVKCTSVLFHTSHWALIAVTAHIISCLPLWHERFMFFPSRNISHAMTATRSPKSFLASEFGFWMMNGSTNAHRYLLWCNNRCLYELTLTSHWFGYVLPPVDVSDTVLLAEGTNVAANVTPNDCCSQAGGAGTF